ncbi:MAG TPA: polysaccharide deacetylase family protein [Spirochaetota bacterium]|nr:polysaccharide deacetylase family protein [Spirochaetota bacterium]HPF05924.1 polysaccharide deacetylase family protein [Spirochaetota bacterium]HPR37612.1 polysaccharide deacetylase family protein [Spirochaetota bacterium]HRX46804.1 polysaccharide deacetylase family protein [Spirochaetota bacterium]
MKIRTALILFTAMLLYGQLYGKESPASGAYLKKRDAVIAKFNGIKPAVFSQWAPGVKTRINTTEKVAALTLDACGGRKGNGYDKELIDFLRENKIPASLFMTALWIDANRELSVELSRDPLFEIENHGYRHKPASVNGRLIYGKRGTKTPGDLFDEIELNAEKIQALTGKRPLFYRPGTAYFDDVAVKLCRDLNHIPMNFSVISGDAAGFSAARIERRILSQVKPGSVIIAHMNHPGNRLCPAMKRSLLKLKAEGYRFVKLSEYKERLK